MTWCGAVDVVRCVQSEYKEQREGERRAKKMVRIKLFPMLLYCLFILAGMFYAYVRVVHGMGGLVTGLQVYSYIVLVIELMGALNMVFYGCWLFAKPVNDDVFPRVDASTVRPPLTACCGVSRRLSALDASSHILCATAVEESAAQRALCVCAVVRALDGGATLSRCRVRRRHSGGITTSECSSRATRSLLRSSSVRCWQQSAPTGPPAHA